MIPAGIRFNGFPDMLFCAILGKNEGGAEHDSKAFRLYYLG